MKLLPTLFRLSVTEQEQRIPLILVLGVIIFFALFFLPHSPPIGFVSNDSTVLEESQHLLFSSLDTCRDGLLRGEASACFDGNIFLIPDPLFGTSPVLELLALTSHEQLERTLLPGASSAPLEIDTQALQELASINDHIAQELDSLRANTSTRVMPLEGTSGMTAEKTARATGWKDRIQEIRTSFSSSITQSTQNLEKLIADTPLRPTEKETLQKALYDLSTRYLDLQGQLALVTEISSENIAELSNESSTLAATVLRLRQNLQHAENTQRQMSTSIEQIQAQLDRGILALVSLQKQLDTLRDQLPSRLSSPPEPDPPIIMDTISRDYIRLIILLFASFGIVYPIFFLQKIRKLPVASRWHSFGISHTTLAMNIFIVSLTWNVLLSILATSVLLLYGFSFLHVGLIFILFVLFALSTHGLAGIITLVDWQPLRVSIILAGICALPLLVTSLMSSFSFLPTASLFEWILSTRVIFIHPSFTYLIAPPIVCILFFFAMRSWLNATRTG